MNEQTLADLMREIGLEPAYQAHFDNRPQRPRPRQMRDPAIRAVDPQLAPSERRRAERQMYEAAQGPSRAEMTAPAYAAPRNQFAEAGQGALELTGLPSVRRSARAFTEGDLRTGAEEGAMGALGVLGMATLAPARGALNRAPVRPVGEPATRLPRHATQLPGRASDGSVLPVREPQPFRNSLRGGSDDLMEAARPQGGLPSGITRNPTDADLARIAELGDEMKYVMDTDGNIYAFNAADMHHNQAMRALRDSGVRVRPLGPGAEVTDPDAAGFIWRNRDGSFVHENANMVESGPFSAFAQRQRPPQQGALRPRGTAVDRPLGRPSPGGALREPIRPPGSEPGDVLARGGSGLPQRRNAVSSLNDEGAQSATGARTNADSPQLRGTGNARDPERFWDDRLSDQQNAIVRWAMTGRTNRQISDAMLAEGVEISPNTIAVQLNRLKTRAPDIYEQIGPSRLGPPPSGQSLGDRALSIWDDLGRTRGAAPVIAERLGISVEQAQNALDVARYQQRRASSGGALRPPPPPKPNDVKSLLAPAFIASWATQGALRPQAAQ